MKTIKLNKGSINLPEKWEDLTEKQVPFVFRELMRLFAKEITPLDFQCNLLCEFTGYKAKKRTGFWYKFKRFFFELIYICLHGSKKYHAMLDLEQMQYENVQINLIALAKELNFAFKLDGLNIDCDYKFLYNPFRYLQFGVKIPIPTPYFNRNITIETNIKAREYADCFDLLTALSDNVDPVIQHHLMAKIFSILYGISIDEALKQAPEVLFGVQYWFSSIVLFFQKHPVYSILYSSENKEDDTANKIKLGQAETLLYLKKEGYHGIEDMNIVDFFNAQLKSLKDCISKALGAGMEIEKLSQETGISIYNLERLS